MSIQSVINSHPIVTNAALGMLVAGIGDSLCQFIEMKDSKQTFTLSTWDYRRSSNLGLIRGFLIVPFVVIWYKKLAKMYPDTTNVSLLKRCLTNELIGSPFCIALVFIGNAFLTSANPMQDFIQRMKIQGIATWANSISFWPLCHLLVTFRLPPTYQPIWASFAAVFWNAILSFHTNIVITEEL